jgi:structural maintenance of chromosome 2
MLGTMLKDKEKIEKTIEELGRYKRDALKTTWEKVNQSVERNTIPVRHLIWLLSRDFGGIFAELLPSNFAKLQRPDNPDLMDDCEI